MKLQEIAIIKRKGSIMLTKNDYQTAIDIQSACNLSGVVYSFARIMDKICKDTTGTNEKNNHAICRLFAEQISYLTSNKDYSQAYTECEGR